MIRRIMSWLVGHGVTHLVMNLHHRPETLTAVVGDGSDLGATVRYSWEQPRVLGSAGGPRHALPLLTSGGTSDPFLIVNGDTLTDLDLKALIADHTSSTPRLVTMALVPNREFLRYGGVLVDGEGNVTGFTKRGPEAEGSWHYIGVQLADPSVFAPLPANVPLHTVGGVYDDLIRTRPGSVRAFRSGAAFWDVGTPADYLRMSRAFSNDPAGTSILWKDVEIGEGATLDECIVADGVRVPAGATYRRSILMMRNGALVVTPIDN